MRISLILATLLLTSCVSLNPIKDNHGTLSESNFTKLNGLYHAQPDSAYKPNLADLLIVNYYLNYPSQKIDTFDDTLELRLKALNLHEIEVRVYRNQVQESKKVLRGELKNGYFVLKQQYEYDPELPIILGFTTRQKSRITINESGNIVVDSEELGNGRILLIPMFFRNRKHYNREFKKINYQMHTQ